MNLGFATPSFLLLVFPVVGLLVYAYLNRGKAKKHFVSSTIIFKQLKNRPTVRQKVKLPWRFFYELLFLTLLVLAVAGFYWQTPGRFWQIVIDNSLSLSAKIDGSANDVLRSNIQQIKTDRKDRFKNLSGVRVCLTSPSYQCWTEGFQPWEEVSAKLDSITAVPANDMLESVLRAITFQSDVDVTIYSDYLTNNRQATSLRLATSRTGALDNLAITEISSKNLDSVSVGVKSFSTMPIQKKLRLYSIQESQNQLEVDQVQESNFRIDPNDKIYLSFKKSKNVQAVVAEIVSDGVSPASDTIALDNIFYQTINQQTSGDVLFVSDSDVASSGIESVFPKKIQQINPIDFEGLQGNRKGYKLIIFDNYIPKTFPTSNHLIIASNAEPGVLTTTLEKSTEITSWDKQSPLLRYLTADNFQFKNIWPAKLPSWFDPIITSDNQTILATGFNEQVRSVYVGFPLLPLEKDRNPALAILSLNIFKWLTEEVEVPANVSEESLLYQLQESGLVIQKDAQVRQVGAGLIWNPKSNQAIVAKNFYSEEESNLQIIKKIALSEPISKTAVSGAGNVNNNINQIIWIVLVMFLGALFIWEREKR